MAFQMGTILRLQLLLLIITPCLTLPRFRFAISLYAAMGDFGWPFHLNVGRINLQKYLTTTYPNMITEHTFGNVPQTWTSDCDPQFEAWAQGGYNLIIGAMGDTDCLAKLATWYPNVTFVTVAGFPAAPPNYAVLWARMYEGGYLTGFTAGLTTKTKKICISAGQRIPSTVMDVSGFCRGVHNADPSVEIHILETGVMNAALMEEWNVNQSYALGCDIAYISSLTIAGCLQATTLGMMSIGWFTDARLTVGELVITSAYVDFTPMFIRAAEAAMNGTFATERLKPDWWMGMEWGSVQVADPSLYVPVDANARIAAQAANVSRTFCGRVCTTSGCLCNTSDCCLTDDQLNTLMEYPDFVIEHGVLQLPGQACKPGQLGTWHIDNFTVTCSDCPAGTYAYNADQVSECRPCPAATYSPAAATQCTACPVGMYSDQEGLGQCQLCPAGSIAANPGSARCNACPLGVSNDDRTQCGSESLVWLAGVGGGVAAAFALVGVWAWHATRKMRQMRRQFSNDNVAVECAAAIARLDLQAVAWLSDIPKPNCIQLSFIRIVKILDEVRKYVPDQLLQSLACADEPAEDQLDSLRKEEEAVTEAYTECESPHDIPSPARRPTRSPIGGTRVHPAGDLRVGAAARSTNRRSGSVSVHSDTSTQLPSCRSTGGQPNLFTARRVTYLLVHFNLSQNESTAIQAGSNLNAFLGHLVETAKAQQGTLGTVGYDRAVVHWGAGRRAVAEAPGKAVETALALAAFSGRLSGGAQLRLNIAIGTGATHTGVVETATNHFFMVGAGPVPTVEHIVNQDWRSTLGVQILITEDVQACVQYTHLCHPRLVLGQQMLWEPIACLKEKGEDEWMYQLQEGEGTAAFSAVLLGPFKALRKGDRAAAEVLARAVQEAHAARLLPTDAAALEWLANTARASPHTPKSFHPAPESPVYLQDSV